MRADRLKAKALWTNVVRTTTEMIVTEARARLAASREHVCKELPKLTGPVGLEIERALSDRLVLIDAIGRGECSAPIAKDIMLVASYYAGCK